MSVTSWPTGITPSAIELTLETNTQSFESTLNGGRQTVILPGSRWKAMLTFSNVMGDKAGQLKGFLAGLGGPSGQFYLPAFDHPTPSGTALGSGIVKGAGQTGKTLLTDGWTANQTALLLPGDYIQIGAAFHIITATAASDSGGNATLTIAPELRSSPADNAAIVTTNPSATMYLVDDSQVKFAQQPGRIYALALACREVIDI